MSDSNWGAIIMLVGLISVVSPHLAFFMDEGWKFQNAEPSALFLLWARISGVIMIAVGFATATGHLSSHKPDPAPTHQAASDSSSDDD